MEIKVEIKDEEVKAMLAHLTSTFADMTPAMRNIGQIVRRSILKNFDAGGRPVKWKPNAAATILAGINRKKDFTKGGRLTVKADKRLSKGKVLIDSSTLRNSINYEAFPDKVKIGPAASVPYGRIHQLGGPAGRGLKVNIPARPYLMVQNEDWTEIRAAMMRYITGEK